MYQQTRLNTEQSLIMMNNHPMLGMGSMGMMGNVPSVNSGGFVYTGNVVGLDLKLD
jgi:hypothetical protein